MKVEIELITIGGVDYITPGQMGAITNKTTMQIYSLIKKGNSIRKMVGLKIGAQWLIPHEEVKNFPFTCVGRRAKGSVYHYNYDGSIQGEEN